MAVIVALAIFIFIFYFIRKHSGPMHLATIAGVAVFNSFGPIFLMWIKGIWPDASEELINHIIYLALVLVFPFLLYFHSNHGGSSGLLRILEAVVSAAIMVSMIAGPLGYFFSFDDLSVNICNFISTIEGPVVLGATIAAYLDILLYF